MLTQGQGDLKTEELNHLEAQSKIKECKGNLKLTLQRVIRKPIIQTDIGFYHEASHAGGEQESHHGGHRGLETQNRDVSVTLIPHPRPDHPGTEAMPEDVVSKKGYSE
ncbi:hypothetical protein QTP70_032330, partial [Hemibagrus guttatus]